MPLVPVELVEPHELEPQENVGSQSHHGAHVPVEHFADGRLEKFVAHVPGERHVARGIPEGGKGVVAVFGNSHPAGRAHAVAGDPLAVVRRLGLELETHGEREKIVGSREPFERSYVVLSPDTDVPDAELLSHVTARVQVHDRHVHAQLRPGPDAYRDEEVVVVDVDALELPEHLSGELAPQLPVSDHQGVLQVVARKSRLDAKGRKSGRPAEKRLGGPRGRRPKHHHENPDHSFARFHLPLPSRASTPPARH
ncbi:MAG: hypothetical protein KatS3mg076_1709 [Candidatus Binatia bacterium]|nr:MAG: hypothetical protein KatS3mg076_1709 [Candidatus Binatia bacterium]